MPEISWDEVIAKIETSMNSIAAERDKLDELISELSHLRDTCDTAYEDLHNARDALSELV